jgi:hypothetical protein
MNRIYKYNTNNNNINIWYFNVQNKVIIASTPISGLSATFVDLVVYGNEKVVWLMNIQFKFIFKCFNNTLCNIYNMFVHGIKTY